METKKVLLTGGAGYIGSHTVLSLINNGFEPVIVDDLRRSDLFMVENLKVISDKDLIFHQVDCCNETELRSVFEEHKNFVGVIHFAAYKFVGESVGEPNMYYKNNLLSLMLILDLMKEFNVDNFVFSSSCTVYGIPEIVPVTEQTPLQEANCPYGFTKQMGERMIMDWSNATGKKVSLLRYFNPIGAHESGLIGDLQVENPQNLVPFMTQSVIGNRGALTVFGNDYDTEDGTCIRDYIHVIDLAEAHVSAMKKSDRDGDQIAIVNIGSGKGSTVLEIINTFEERTGEKVDYIIGDRRPGDVPVIYADCSYGESYLDWKAQLSIGDALEHAWKWENYLKNR